MVRYKKWKKKGNSHYDGNGLAGQFSQMESALRFNITSKYILERNHHSVNTWMKELTLFLFHKNIFYKNIETEICDILRIFPREASFVMSSRARVYHKNIVRPAWFSLGYKSIEFGWCPPWRHPESWRQSALWVSRQPIAIDEKAPGFIHEDGFFHLWIITMFTVGESPPNISGK